jgi:PAS domain S-box-containing protein
MGHVDMAALEGPACDHGHLVQFYETEQFLVDTVCAFLLPTLRDGNAAIVAATAAHRHAFDTALTQAGIDVDAAVRAGRYLAFDAADLLSQFMVAGRPDPERYRDTIGAVMDYASQDGREIRVYGEMVALLYDDGDTVSALALEDLWNDLAETHAFELLCAYPMRFFDDEAGAAAYKRICDQHSTVIPNEGYPPIGGPVEQSRAVAKLQQELRMLARGSEQSTRSTSILDAAGDGIFGADASGTLTFVNPAALRMTGYALEELVGHDMHDLLHHSRPDGSSYPRCECPTLGSLAERSVHHSDHDVYWRKDGTAFAVEYTSTPIIGDDRITGAVVVFRDITARREIERAKDEFTSVVSHELRTPLTSIRASLGLLESGALGTLPEDGRRMIQIAVQNTDRLVRLIRDILDLERIDSGSMQLRTTSCDAADVVGCATEAVLAMALDADVKLETDAPPAAFAGDGDRLIQTLTNLLANAVKFSSPGGAVRITSEQRDGEMRFEVRDHGRGIPADKLETIFERFTQVDSSDARQHGGTGLGLAICRSIVECHGGRIWAHSEPGQGSTFTVVIPATRGDEQRHAHGAGTAHDDLAPGDGVDLAA